MKRIFWSFPILVAMSLVFASCAGNKQELKLKQSQKKTPKYEHRFCIMTKFEVPSDAIDANAPNPACEIEDPKTGTRQQNPQAMHLNVNIIWKTTAENGDKKELKMNGLSTTFCLTKDRLFVEACESDDHLKKTLPLRFPFEKFKAEFKQHPFVAQVSRTFRVSPFVELLPPSMWPLTVNWPVHLEYPNYEVAANHQWERLTSPPLLIKRVNYLIIVAQSASGDLEPVLCDVEAKVPKPKEAGGGFESKKLNPNGESAIALINSISGTMILINLDGFTQVVLEVGKDLSISGPKENLIESVRLNTYESVYLVRLNQITPQPRHDPRSRM